MTAKLTEKYFWKKYLKKRRIWYMLIIICKYGWYCNSNKHKHECLHIMGCTKSLLIKTLTHLDYTWTRSGNLFWLRKCLYSIWSHQRFFYVPRPTVELWNILTVWSYHHNISLFRWCDQYYLGCCSTHSLLLYI